MPNATTHPRLTHIWDIIILGDLETLQILAIEETNRHHVSKHMEIAAIKSTVRFKYASYEQLKHYWWFQWVKMEESKRDYVELYDVNSYQGHVIVRLNEHKPT